MLRKGQELGKNMGNTPLNVLAMENQPSRRPEKRDRAPRFGQMIVRREEVLSEDTFQSLLMLERRRAERSSKRFVLMLLDARSLPASDSVIRFMTGVISVLCRSTRETDLVGWYKEGQVLAVLFTEINCEGETPITELLQSKVLAALLKELDKNLLSQLQTSIHLFPKTGIKAPLIPLQTSASTRIFPRRNRESGWVCF